MEIARRNLDLMTPGLEVRLCISQIADSSNHRTEQDCESYMLPNQEVQQRIIHKEEKTFLNWWSDNEMVMIRLAENRLRNSSIPSDAEDVCQDIFLRYVKMIRSQTSPAGVTENSENLERYIRRCILHRCIDTIRRHKRIKHVTPEFFEDEKYQRSADDDTCKKQQRLEEVAERTVQQLSEKHHRVWDLWRHERLTYKQIARQTNTTRGSVSNSIRTGKKHVTNAIQKYLEDDDDLDSQ